MVLWSQSRHTGVTSKTFCPRRTNTRAESTSSVQSQACARCSSTPPGMSPVLFELHGQDLCPEEQGVWFENLRVSIMLFSPHDVVLLVSSGRDLQDDLRRFAERSGFSSWTCSLQNPETDNRKHTDGHKQTTKSQEAQQRVSRMSVGFSSKLCLFVIRYIIVRGSMQPSVHQ